MFCSSLFHQCLRDLLVSLECINASPYPPRPPPPPWANTLILKVFNHLEDLAHGWGLTPSTLCVLSKLGGTRGILPPQPWSVPRHPLPITRSGSPPPSRPSPFLRPPPAPGRTPRPGRRSLRSRLPWS